MVRESPWRIDVENFHKMHNTGCARCWDVKGPSVKDTMPLGSGDRRRTVPPKGPSMPDAAELFDNGMPVEKTDIQNVYELWKMPVIFDG